MAHVNLSNCISCSYTDIQCHVWSNHLYKCYFHTSEELYKFAFSPISKVYTKYKYLYITYHWYSIIIPTFHLFFTSVYINYITCTITLLYTALLPHAGCSTRTTILVLLSVYSQIGDHIVMIFGCEFCKISNILNNK